MMQPRQNLFNQIDQQHETHHLMKPRYYRQNRSPQVSIVQKETENMNFTFYEKDFKQ